MSKRPITRCGTMGRAFRWPKPATGFTLIELMVAMLLGLIVIAGVVSVFLANQRSYRTNQALSDVQDSSRIAFELMANDIRNAGYTGCDSNGRIANVLHAAPGGGGTSTWWADWGNAVHGYPSAPASGSTSATPTPDPALTVGTAEGNQSNGTGQTDSLQLLGAADTGLSVAATPSSVAASFMLNDATTNLAKGDVIIVCDPDHAAIVQISDYSGSGSSVTVTHNDGNGVSPGNCSKGLGYPTVCTTNGNGYSFGANSQVFKLAAVDWYIGANQALGTSLYRLSVGTSGVTAAQEMVRDVTAMNIRYHQAGSTSFVDANTVGSNWGVVDAVQVQLTLESADKRAGTDVKAISRSFTATNTVRNRVK
jgi:type IV pilus assembly protein PilW